MITNEIVKERRETRRSFYATLAAITLFFSAQATDVTIQSPDKQIRVDISISKEKAPVYAVTFKGSTVVDNAQTGFQDNQPLTIVSSKRSSVDRHLPLLFSGNNDYHEVYNELLLRLTGDRTLTFRVYNDGVAFKYGWMLRDSVVMEEEHTTFPIHEGILFQQDISDEPVEKWAAVNGNEVKYKAVEASAMSGTAELPLLVRSKNWSALINEAGNTGYARGVLEKKGDGLQMHLLSRNVLAKGAYQSPWRYILIAGNTVQLVNKADLIYSLCPPATTGNTSWIKPGKVMRCMRLTTEDVRQTIDFCHAMHVEYVLLDAGWYGLGYGMSKEFRPESDALKTIDGLDIPGVVQYGKSKNVGIILYVNEVGMQQQQLPKMLALYKQWGVAGLKFGFVNSRTQKGLALVMEELRQTGKAGFIVDIHDNYRSTGLSRTYPYLLTQEGVRGAENVPDAEHNTILPFARFTTGAADYTIIYKGFRYKDSSLLTVDERQDKIARTAGTQAHQLALSVIFFSPLQCVFWYGKAADYDTASTDVEFFKYVPTVWDRSIAVMGEPGDYITMARRSKDTWFVGSITNSSARSWPVPLTFLSKGKKYIASVYEDDGKGGIRKRNVEVSSLDSLQVTLGAAGGQAVMIRPLN